MSGPRRDDTYPLLGAVFGGSPGGTFTIPDMRGMVPVGSDSTNFPTLGATVGSLTITHAHGSAAHSHTSPGHSHTSDPHTHSIAAHSHNLSASGWAQVWVSTSGVGMKRANVTSYAETIASTSTFSATSSTTARTLGASLDGGTDSGGPTVTGSTTPANVGSTAAVINSTTPADTDPTLTSTLQPSRVVHYIIRAA